MGKPSEKLIPAATFEDQEAEVTPIVLGMPPFSSPNPATDGIKMIPIEDGTSGDPGNPSDEAVAAAEEQGVEQDKALKASEWVALVNDADDQDALDNIAQRYEASGADFKTVDEAINEKQDELNG